MASRSCPSENGGFLQVSGLCYTIDTALPSCVTVDGKGMFVKIEGTRRIQNVQVYNSGSGTYEPISLTKIYTLASHNYMHKSAGDGINMFTNNRYLLEGIMIDNQVLINYIVDGLNGVVGANYGDPHGQGRIVAVETAP
ncbi:hypothetical protein SDC9_123726 [bioreactor metagenome]|uniref:5'-Nucleotidase C-terminal domain-containing protein n=1 Tax=bioreactor metagenome TaxID=1076179 RepID=A0A645CIF8_9ZZZZ